MNVSLQDLTPYLGVNPQRLRFFAHFEHLDPVKLHMVADRALIQTAPPSAQLLRRDTDEPWNLYLLEGTVTLTAEDGSVTTLEGGTPRARAPLAFLRPRKYTVTALTKLLRIGLSKGDEVIPVREEVEHVRNYLIIQKMRYGQILDYSLDVPEELNEHKIVKLVLQPLVENALYHGIKNKEGKGHIEVSARREGRAIVFSVSDTGVGMAEEKLRALEGSLNDPEARSDGFGLKNVSDRIRVYFGEGHGLSFRSHPGQGTTVSFSIPLDGQA